MKILLNDQPIEVEGLTPEVTLGGLIEALAADLKGKGLTIVKITADGTVIDPEDLQALQSRRVLDCETIDLLAATPAELVHIMVSDSTEVLPYLKDLATQIAGDLRIGQVKEAMNNFLKLVEGLEWLATLLSNIPTGFAAAMHESDKELRRRQILTETQRHLTTLRNSQESQDWVGLADILEYELPELFSECHNFFGGLQQM